LGDGEPGGGGRDKGAGVNKTILPSLSERRGFSTSTKRRGKHEGMEEDIDDIMNT